MVIAFGFTLFVLYICRRAHPHTADANIIGKVIYCSTTVLDTVLAIPNPPIMYLAMKKATKLKKAAHSTA